MGNLNNGGINFDGLQVVVREPKLSIGFTLRGWLSGEQLRFRAGNTPQDSPDTTHAAGRITWSLHLRLF